MSKAYGVATGAKKPRGDRFMALSILAVRVQPQLKGEKKKSWACSIESFGSPTVDHWKSYFVGYNEWLKEKILADFEAWEGFGSPDQEIAAQQQSQPVPASIDDSEPIYDYDEDF